MRLLRLAIPVALLSLVVACGSSNTTTSTPPAAAPTSAPATSSAPTGSSEPSSSSSSGSTKTLTGTLEATAFTITLKDATGADVTTLPAGTYQVKITDPSAIHNFHLTGPGGVDMTTGTVDKIVDVTWPITLVAGEYTYKCDPHPNMVKKFTVT
jgi:plastocyanin